MVDPVRPIAIEDIESARTRIARTVPRAPLVRIDDRIFLKLENLQPTNAYKIRGAHIFHRSAGYEAATTQRQRGLLTSL